MSKNLKGAIRNISHDHCHQRSMQSLAIKGILVYIPPSKYGPFANSTRTLLTSHVGIMKLDENTLHNEPRPDSGANDEMCIIILTLGDSHPFKIPCLQ